jgi:oligoribonuclease NrnB/cAMP/cGMP phosphodiesterase (DHH superfamily)|tara:strand:+ start:85 stop:1041 length:957 start_codon:yes stop_codon:yes gene_type:complete
MTNYDVFNGDTDGIFAWHQLRLTHPRDAEIVTGVKRDVNLASKVNAEEGDLVTIMDVSHAKNRKDVQRILDSGAIIEYFDHHDPKELIEHPNITYHINTEPNISTGLIVNSHVNGQNRLWSIATAFGDNHLDLAMNMAKSESLSDEQVLILKQIGLVVNYNSYGQTIEDLFYSPEEIAEAARACGSDIFKFLEQGDIFSTLLENFNADMSSAVCQEPFSISENGVIYTLPNEAWTHRIMGSFSNHLVSTNKNLACAIAVLNSDGTYRISVRSSINNPHGAGNLCGNFGGGGREKAGGINNLPASDMNTFKEEFDKVFS